MKHFYAIIALLLCMSCAGPKGNDGVMGPTGAPGSDGRAGSDGTNGNDGHDGATGPAGLVGPQGPAGLAGTQFTFVQLCPGAPSYPHVFIELAMCVNGDLYGVYSANGGFYTYFPPGAYSSAGIGSACNLTIHANCTITH